jgi:mRNA-degrading endonuclease toxin of MazEF toxin-antitoxin module
MHPGLRMSMERGEIWLRAGLREAGDTKLRPVLVISPSWRNQLRASVVVLPFSTRLDLHTPLRLLVKAAPGTGLEEDSLLYCDDPATILKTRLCRCVGRLPQDVVDQACDLLRESLE